MMNKIWEYEDFLRTPLSPPAWSLQIITLKKYQVILGFIIFSLNKSLKMQIAKLKKDRIYKMINIDLKFNK